MQDDEYKDPFLQDDKDKEEDFDPTKSDPLLGDDEVAEVVPDEDDYFAGNDDEEDEEDEDDPLWETDE